MPRPLWRKRRSSFPSRALAARGFTLVELLVAIAIMATMAFMSWRALAGMSQAEALTHARADDLLAIQAGLGQWTADLDALADTGHTPALDFDGRTLRLTRRDALEGDHHSPGVQVVAWSLQQGQWRRWQVAGLRSRQAVSLASVSRDDSPARAPRSRPRVVAASGQASISSSNQRVRIRSRAASPPPAAIEVAQPEAARPAPAAAVNIRRRRSIMAGDSVM
ncbi:MAG: prepilin-type N-terminal cleavage/methylation domain-containing protein [Burkholderiaceae bacterium]|nr:prepilin-type N-terminal cleavage/methylation domain-containing protein [Burkholderiaceae bacterium]